MFSYIYNDDLRTVSAVLLQIISDVWMVPIVSEEAIDFAPEVSQTKLFEIKDIELE